LEDVSKKIPFMRALLNYNSMNIKKENLSSKVLEFYTSLTKKIFLLGIGSITKNMDLE
jgi:hypothetical protein